MTSVPATAHSKDELIRALPIIMGEMRRVPVLKDWDDAQRKGLIQLQEPHRTFVGQACMDSSILAVRALDEFFRTRRAAPKGSPHLKKAKPGDLFAEEFGYTDDLPLLSGPRRADINQLMSHFTWRRIDENLKIDARDDLVCVIGHCVRFLTWLIETNFLDGHSLLAADVVRLRSGMQRCQEDPNWGRQLHLDMPESIMKATAVALSGSAIEGTFNLWRTSAAEHGATNDDMMRFRADLPDLALLIDVLTALCARVGIDASFEDCQLGQLSELWKERHRSVLEHIASQQK